MDVLNSEDGSNYEDYYNAEGLEEYGLCKKTHLKEFSNLFLTIFYSITCALSIIANLILLIAFIKHKTLRKVLPLHMVISDFIFTLSLPFWAVYASSEWIFGDQSCKAITLVQDLQQSKEEYYHVHFGVAFISFGCCCSCQLC